MEDPPEVIHVPLLCSAGGKSDLRRSGRRGERGGLLRPHHKHSRCSAAAWFEDGNPADQPVEDQPGVILVPLSFRGGNESNLHRGRRHGERGILVGPRQYNRPAVRPVAPDAAIDDVLAAISVAARGGVGEIAAKDELVGESRGERGLPGAHQLLPPAEDGVVRRICNPPVAHAADGVIGRVQPCPVALVSRVQGVPVAIPIVESGRVGEAEATNATVSSVPPPSLVARAISAFWTFPLQSRSLSVCVLGRLITRLVILFLSYLIQS